MPNKKPLTNTNGLIKEFSNDEVRTIKFKFDAINAPTSTDDVNSGYSVGSKWYDVNNNIEYTCLDNTNNNAVWKSQTYGNQGAQGYQGSAGVNGTQGNQGYQGSAGVNGTQGSEGYQGSAGVNGRQGNQGYQVVLV